MIRYWLATQLYVLLSWLAEHGTATEDTGSEYTIAWGPFEQHESTRYDYLRADLNTWPIGLSVSDEAGQWLVWVGSKHHYITIECFKTGRREHRYTA